MRRRRGDRSVEWPSSTAVASGRRLREETHAEFGSGIADRLEHAGFQVLAYADPDRVLDRAGISRRAALGQAVDINALRHTPATSVARRGTPRIVAQKVLGHAFPDMTAKVYTHVGLEDLQGGRLRARVPCRSAYARRGGDRGPA